jgi:hypothetical protein
LFLDLTPNYRLTPNELIHRVLFNPGRTVFNRAALLVAYHVRVHSQRNSWVTMPQLQRNDRVLRRIGQDLIRDCGRMTGDAEVTELLPACGQSTKSLIQYCECHCDEP